MIIQEKKIISADEVEKILALDIPNAWDAILSVWRIVYPGFGESKEKLDPTAYAFKHADGVRVCQHLLEHLPAEHRTGFLMEWVNRGPSTLSVDDPRNNEEELKI